MKLCKNPDYISANSVAMALHSYGIGSATR